MSHRPDKTDWTTVTDLKDRVRRDWDNGRLPIAVAGGDSPFPLRLSLKVPASAELGEHFESARAWITGLKDGAATPGYQLEWREFDHRQLGRNQVPVAALFDQAEDAIAFIGKHKEARRLVSLIAAIVEAQPALSDWCRRRPLVILEQAGDWPVLLACLHWFATHSRSDRYIRQIDAPGVHSKFVESHRGLLSELLDLILSPADIDPSATGVAGFARRYGLRDKPLMVRFRLLDPTLAISKSPLPSQHLSLPAADFARLPVPPGLFHQVFITENEINFLAFPDLPNSLIIFGSGYGFDMLADARWLQDRRLRYWGDLDTHGFAILDQLRDRFPTTESLLMDHATLLAHQPLWTSEPKPTQRHLSRLTAAEQAVYDDLRYDRRGQSVRLEQERISFGWVEKALELP